MKTRLLGASLILAGSLAFAQEVHIGVLSLFHPRQLTVRPFGSAALVVHAGQESLVLEQSSGVHLAHVRLAGDYVVLQAGARTVQSTSLHITGRDNGPTDFRLAVPGKITRYYRGTLDLNPAGGVLIAVVSMDVETAAASVVAAESTSDTRLEALKAQAVVARSYLVAGKGRHKEFDFCDTTHCQFLREPPAPSTAAAKAVDETRGLVLTFESQPFAAMYTRSCSGRTRTPADLSLPAANYPYYAVDCEYCRQHPARWQSQVSAQDAAGLRNSSESARLKIARLRGWDVVPSNTFTIKKEGEHYILRGVGLGHGVGLCQSGAQALAEQGATFLQILTHYYPNATVSSSNHQQTAR